jgi:hypothetical protein
LLQVGDPGIDGYFGNRVSVGIIQHPNQYGLAIFDRSPSGNPTIQFGSNNTNNVIGLDGGGNLAVSGGFIVNGAFTAGKSLSTFNGDVTVKGNLNVEGKLTASQVYTQLGNPNQSWWLRGYGGDSGPTPYAVLDSTSDQRLKTDISPLPEALQKVCQLRGITYRWNEEAIDYFRGKYQETIFRESPTTGEEGGKQLQAEGVWGPEEFSGLNLGLIAQEVEAVIPEVVTTDKAGYKAIKYGQLTALLIEAIKEQSKLIESLTARINALEGVKI